MFLLSVWLVATLIFALFFILPGNPTYEFLPKGANGYYLQWAIDKDLRLSDPISVQYVNFLFKTFTGKFFISAAAFKGDSIGAHIYDPMARTLVMFAVAVLFSIMIGWIVGYFISSKRRSAPGRFVEISLTLLFSIPASALSLLTLPSLKWLGYKSPLFAVLTVLGAILLTFGIGALTVKRANPGAARPGGSSASSSFSLRSLLETTSSIPGIVPKSQLLIGWTMVCVLIFDIPFWHEGLGSLMWAAINLRDRILLVSCIFIIAMIVAVANFLFDLFVVLARYKASQRQLPADATLETDDFSASTDGREILMPVPSLSLGSIWREYNRGSWVGVLALILICVTVAAAIAAPVISTVPNPDSPSNFEPSIPENDRMNPFPPSFRESPTSGLVHPLGTDHIGRDVYSMLVYGSRSFVIDGLDIVLLCAAASVATWLLAMAVMRMDLVLAKTSAIAATIFADAILSLPLFVAFVAVVDTSAHSTVISRTWIFILLIGWALSVKVAIERLYRPNEAVRKTPYREQEDRGSRAEIKPVVPQVMTWTLHVTKFVVVIWLLSISALEFFGLGNPAEISWGNMFEEAYQREAVMTGAWWTYVPALICTMFAIAALYIALDTLEHAFRKHAQDSDL